MTGSLRRISAEIFAWLLPLVVVAEYVGTTFGNTVVATLGLLGLFLGALWLAPPELPAKPLPAGVVLVGRVLGVALVAVAIYGLLHALPPIVDPVHHPPPPQPTLREREAFLYAGVLWCYPAAFGWRLLRGRAEGRDVERLGLFIALVFLAHLAGKQSVQGLPVLPYARPDLALALVTAEVVLWTLVFVPRIPSYFRLWALLGAGLGLRYVGLSTWQLDPGLRDMLPLVKSAQDAFVAGINPYGLHQMQPGSIVPLTYLPGMWLLWGLPRLVGGDLRLTGLLADAAVVAGLYWAASGVAKPLRERARGVALGFGAVWLFSPSMAWNGIYAEPHAWWLVFAILLAATLRRRWWLAAAALGLAVATRHFALVAAPFVLLAMLRDLRWRRALPRVALAGSITALCYVPFVVREPGSFWFGTYRWLVEYGPVHQSWFWEKFGFSGPLYKAQAAEWMTRAQVALPLACFVLALYVKKGRTLFAALGTAYVLFVMFNGIIWDSFYLGCSLLAAFAAVGGHALDQRSPANPVRPSRRVLGASIALTALALAAGAWLAFSLVSSQSQAGRDEAKSFLARSLAPGDVLVDRTAWNVAFVQQKPLFDQGPPPVPVGRDVLDAALGPTGAFGRERAFFVLRDDRDASLAESVRHAGAVFADEHLGHYRVLGVRDLGIVTRLAERLTPAPGEPAPRACRVGGQMRQLVGLQPAAHHPARARASAVPLTHALLVVAGIEDGAVAFGREPVELRVLIDGQPEDTLHLPNLPGLRLLSVETASRAGAGHEISLELATKAPAPRWVCADAWTLGAKL